MQARFLLGPAGSGKTRRCLREIRAALAVAAGGKPLILIAPKQATFQLERQLLSDPSLQGYARLHILSFDRFAQFLLDETGVAAPAVLSEEGRIMVLRALLTRHADQLRLFRGSARRPGFAQDLALLFNELQQHQLTPARLSRLAQDANLHRELRAKVLDLALLSEKYADWLRDHALQDGNHLLEFTTGTLLKRRAAASGPNSTAVREAAGGRSNAVMIQHLWLDGFAEMTPQELDLLAAALAQCETATLAFCLEEFAREHTEHSWLSIWSSIGRTFQQCRRRIQHLAGGQIEVEILPRRPGNNRFSTSPALRHLEQGWSHPNQRLDFPIPNPGAAVRIVACRNAGAEAAYAASHILRFVRAGNRYRDCAVLVRNLDAYHKPLARALLRYQIPFFLDRRESVAHHPLAELTRSALRSVAFDWQLDDWFAALKAGFSPATEDEIDRLENESLARGWRGRQWLEQIHISDNPELGKSLECLRRRIIRPFERLANASASLKNSPNGAQLAEGLRELWAGLNVESALEQWSLEAEMPATGQRAPAVHATVWHLMNSWLENLELAFAADRLPLGDWLPILEAGLASLTAGVVPPALDQVLIGAIDRARNPDLKLALVLGVNESVFPATPAARSILTDADRDALAGAVSLGPDLREQLARERYYGYVACTRASEQLVVTYSHLDADGTILNPSPFIANLRQIFPGIEIQPFRDKPKLTDAQCAHEMVAPLMKLQDVADAGEARRGLTAVPGRLGSDEATPAWQNLLELPVLKSLAKRLEAMHEPDPAESLSPMLAEKLYGPVLRSSVSRLEEFAECPFKFFVRVGLRAAERKRFELDARERGDFQHDVLKRFHDQLAEEGRHWRDIVPAEARERIRTIAAAQMEQFRDGLFRDSAATAFAARALADSLQDFVAVIVAWMRGQYEFEPAAAELGFGGKHDSAPAWEMDLGGGHRLALQGRIDRVDVWRERDRDAALAVVTDYKSGGQMLDKILVEHGVQLQLLAYLGALRSWPPGVWAQLLAATAAPDPTGGARAESGGSAGIKVIPAGAFYVNLRGDYKGGGTRADILAEADAARRRAYRHTGRFDAGALDRLDRIHAMDQFNYRLNQDGSLRKDSHEAMSHAGFEKLLDHVETQLRAMGERIFAGEAKVDPFRKGNQTPCEYCDYPAACRMDKWTHPYRFLRARETNDGRVKPGE